MPNFTREDTAAANAANAQADAQLARQRGQTRGGGANFAPSQQMPFLKVLDLYRAMPGAPPIPVEDGVELVGDVMTNQHWAFCKLIFDLVNGG